MAIADPGPLPGMAVIGLRRRAIKRRRRRVDEARTGVVGPGRTGVDLVLRVSRLGVGFRIVNHVGLPSIKGRAVELARVQFIPGEIFIAFSGAFVFLSMAQTPAIVGFHDAMVRIGGTSAICPTVEGPRPPDSHPGGVLLTRGKGKSSV